MAAALINYEERLRQAVRFFWRGRREAATKQQATGKLDQGNRGAVTGGKNLDAFRDMIVDVVNRHGPEGCEVHRGKTMVVLPGFFRPKSPHFPTDKIFHSSSYQQRMKILCERMLEQQLYSCASMLVAPNESKSGDSSHLSINAQGLPPVRLP